MSLRVKAFLSSSSPNDESELLYSSFVFFFVARLDTDASDDELDELLELLLSSELLIDWSEHCPSSFELTFLSDARLAASCCFLTSS